MGSLSQLADPPTVEQLVHAPLTNLETTLNSLLTSLTTTPTYSTAPGITNSLLTADDALTSALQTLYTHQKNYARILALRAEAERLENRIRDTVRTCLDLRKEIDDVNPGLLMRDESDEEDEEGDGSGSSEKLERDVDYHTLLSLASRIGKHNVVAEKEAEEESVRRLLQAREKEREEALKTRSNNATNTAATTLKARTNGIDMDAHETENATTAKNTKPPAHSGSWITQNERDWLDSEGAMERARKGMAFPPGERLRMGLLGRLQWTREQGGEEAVERLLAELEGKKIDVASGHGGDDAGVLPVEELAQQQQQRRTDLPSRRPLTSSQQQHQQTVTRPPVPQQPPERKKSVALDLDMWNEDDEDED